MKFSRLSPQNLFDLHYPDFSSRHIFTAKLRLIILTGFWLLCIFYYPGLITLDQPILLIVSLTFVITTISYGFILRDIWATPFFIIELAADVAAQTVLVYLTGGPQSSFFTIYLIYCVAGGLFYNWRVSTAIALLAVGFYAALVGATEAHWIAEFHYPFQEASLVSLPTSVQNWSLMVIFLLIGVYGIRISSYFTQLRERALQAKNNELTALNQVSSMTRSVLSLELVTKAVLRALRDGLGFDASLLLLVDAEAKKVKVFVDDEAPLPKEIEEMLGFRIRDLWIPLEAVSNPIFQAMKERRPVIRFELATMTEGAVPEVPRKKAEEIQRRFGFKKFVAAPLVAEQNLLGAIIGITRRDWVEAEVLRTFEGFADQAALAIDNVTLIGALKRKNEELERVSRIKSEFLATMSHELRTPLTAIIGFSELLTEEVMGSLNAEQKDSVREVLINGENLLQLINGLLDLAKIEAGRMELSIGPIDFGELIHRVQKMIASLVQKKGHTLEVKISKTCPTIYADERKLQQVLLNLLSNAIKFTPTGGNVRIDALYQPALVEDLRVHVVDPKKFQDGLMQVSVSDSGIGIEDKDVRVIFEAFRQGDSSYTREHAGTGLGLALTKEFIELHGGAIWVETRKGGGSRFIFIIPNLKKTLSESAEE